MHTAPHPPPFRWLKRLSCALLLLLTILLILRLVAGHLANRRLATLLDQYRRAGQPLLPSDFESPPLPASENAALLLRDAAEALRLTGTQSEALDNWDDHNWDDLRPTPELQAAITTAAAANPVVLEKLRRARSLPKANWNIKLTTPVALVRLKDLHPQGQLLNFLHAAALCAHHFGDDGTAAELIQDILRISRAAESLPLGDAAETTLSARRRAAAAIHLSAHDWRIISFPPSAASTPKPADSYPWAFGPATREQTLSLICDLLDEDSFRASFSRSFLFDRMFAIDGLDAVAAGRLRSEDMYGWPNNSILPSYWDRAIFAAIKPLAVLHCVGVIDRSTRAAQLATLPDWPATQDSLPSIDPVSQHAILEALQLFYESRRSDSITSLFKTLADSRTAAILLGLRLYQLDHANQFPPDLAALVPAYLPAIPADPFAPNHQPFRYKPHPTRPLVYSLGFNATDDGGSDRVISQPRAFDFPSRWDALDAVYPFVPSPPTTRPSRFVPHMSLPAPDPNLALP